MLLAGAALLLAGLPAVAGCEAGLNAPTVEFHPVGFGAYATANGITVNNAFILGPRIGEVLPPGSQAGLFLSLYSSTGDRLEKASANGATSVQILPGTVNVPDGGTASLNGPAPQLVLTGLTAPLAGGQTVAVALTFATAGTVIVYVPVQPQANAYATFQQPVALQLSPAATAIGTATASATSTAHTTARHTKKHHPKPKATASATPSPTP